ncbi:hypothetical protein Mp_3g17230 [Marchantia polymorpha subsp. ruderalis]|uniref:Uncharacterized protein n=2 Tax=Marchantia polymorpha TaxID=3197 RepID=A0AAF6B1R2_MARPO|nr:hypothetical protein MARPO_0039s0071 [Marchantia polymorpha]BBN05946.1 hypothetical protein Mp_3g17230 [Marchantia polymorpha subsp. ruderalis]|eukprot:PTQ40578.1 hypothetical protein MARPO_0039s0071 [Marchantia polymorpha]
MDLLHPSPRVRPARGRAFSTSAHDRMMLGDEVHIVRRLVLQPTYVACGAGRIRQADVVRSCKARLSVPRPWRSIRGSAGAMDDRSIHPSIAGRDGWMDPRVRERGRERPS